MNHIKKFLESKSNMIKSTGVLEFSPQDRTRKHKNQSSWKKTAMIMVDSDIDEYYSWFLKKRFNLELNRTLRGSHITIISDKMDFQVFEDAAKIFDGREIDFFYDPKDINSTGKHWWLNVECTDAENIRESMGLKRTPYFGFHLTLGYANEKNIDHSRYIINQIKKFGL